MAFDTLKGVGDASLGEWEMWNPEQGVFHLKRRLTPEEQAPIGKALDIRGTSEAAVRRAAVLSALPADVRLALKDWKE